MTKKDVEKSVSELMTKLEFLMSDMTQNDFSSSDEVSPRMNLSIMNAENSVKDLIIEVEELY